MILIIGGAYQGKKAYADSVCPGISWIDGAACTEEALFSCSGVVDFQEFIRRQLMEGRDVSDLAEKLFDKNPEIAVISCEVGYGVVPIDAFQREYRECVGRICTKLAASAKEVHRVVCGLGTVIKHA